MATDSQMLDALLGIQDRLSDKEQQAFDSMHKQLKFGKRQELTKNQRDWVARVYMDFQLDAGDVENLFSTGKVKATAKNAPKLGFETMPKPMRPPRKKSA